MSADVILVDFGLHRREDAWTAAIADTLNRRCRWHPIPRDVAEGFTAFALNYRDYAGKTCPEGMDWDWLFQHFVRLSGAGGGAA